jgi:hypothetical protein
MLSDLKFHLIIGFIIFFIHTLLSFRYLFRHFIILIDIKIIPSFQILCIIILVYFLLGLYRAFENHFEFFMLFRKHLHIFHCSV